MDWVVLAATVIAVSLVAGIVIHLVSVLSSEEDKHDGFFTKFLVILSFIFASLNVLMLPFDVAITQMDLRNIHHPLDVILIWTVIIVGVVFLCLVVCPFVLTYCEVGSQEGATTYRRVALATAVVVLVVALSSAAVYAGWHTSGFATVNFAEYSISGTPATSFELIKEFSSDSQTVSVRMKVSPFVYLVASLCVGGWVFLSIFGGIGLVAVPQELLLYFRDRPRPITASEYAYRRDEVARESQRLIDKGRMIEEASGGHSYGGHIRKVLAFRQAVRELEAYHTTIEVSYHQQGGTVLNNYLCLLEGIVFTFLSIMWSLHVVVFNVSHVHTLLSSTLRSINELSVTLCVTVYSCLAFYLVLCTLKGCIKLGGNLALYHIYPIDINSTSTASLLFNAILFLATSTTVLQFCVYSFRDYAVNTWTNVLFSVFVLRLDGIKYVIFYSQYLLVVVACLALMWLLVSPRRYTRISRW
uniref:LMBR1-like membrane protein n=1 Tax=Trypanosoma congolense (strain IL3000) TaxID=1068625 RepID=G0UW29_TRYCI|nr:conserved hypothetical protein [Trypanosoma congolense IL3000]